MQFAISIFIVFNVIIATQAQSCPSYTADTRSVSGVIRDVWGCADPSLPGSSLQSSYPACGEQLNSGEPTPACKVAGSGWSCAADFERAIGDDVGLVQNTIDTTNRIPLLNPLSPRPTVINTTQFSFWYRDNPFNIPFTQSLSLSNAATCNSRVYQYDNSNFYPINGRGFGNQYNNRNYGFTFNFQARFTYMGDEVFTFVGDDDVWVYINDILAIDLGGVHAAQTASINLTWPSGGCPANPPLPPCSTANTEKTPCACILRLSNPATTTRVYSFDLFYNERHTVASNLKFTTSILLQCPWFDWCGVCQGTGQTCCNCTDNNLCTTDTCNSITGACIFTPKTCTTPTNKCRQSACSSSTGECVESNINCNGTDRCRVYGCDPAAGCTVQTRSCDDGDPCTIDSCNSNTGCVNTPRNCNDNNFCTTDSCQNGNCLNVQITCNQGNACTNNTCDPTNPTPCSYRNITNTCLTGNRCFIEGCNAVSGCTRTAVTCNDNNACTTDSCNPSTGCVFTNISCNDGDACTVDSCDAISGCSNSPRNCNDGRACTIDTCNSQTGCQYSLRSCDDEDACTIDSCNNATGCSHVAVTCNDNNPCTQDTCDSVLGCQYSPLSCFWCQNRTCPQTSTPCSIWTCQESLFGNCTNFNVSCDDANPCTIDSCTYQSLSDNATCSHVAKDCSGVSPDACHPAACNSTTGECYTTPVVCDDGNRCTDDTCQDVNGVATCVFEPKTCTTTDLCKPQSCDVSDGVCKEIPIICNDGNLCTTDTCEAGSCSYKSIECDTSDACLPQECNSGNGKCEVTPVVCEDNNACTNNTCVTNNGEAECVFISKTCPETKCNVASCDADTGDCSVTPRAPCNDSNACTRDTCDDLEGCVFTLISCDDGDACTEDTCDSSAGCVHTAILCDDNDKCTNDTCDASTGCVYTDIVVPVGNKCLGIYCDPTLGIVSIPTECPTACSGCDPLTGCTDCPGDSGISVEEVAGMGAGVLAALIIGAVAAFALISYSGKKGVEYLMKSKAQVSEVSDNPLYEKSSKEFESPIFESATNKDDV